MISKHMVGGRLSAFKVEILKNGRSRYRKYFSVDAYGSQVKAKQAALKYDEELQGYYNKPNYRNIFTADNHILGLRLRRERNNRPYMVAQARCDGDKLTIYRSLATNDWEQVFEELVKALLIHYRVALTSDLAFEIESKKKFYDPTKRTNWTRGIL